MIPGLDSAKCEQRNRIAALRYGVNAAPFRLMNADDIISGHGNIILSRQGALPTNLDGAMKAINAKLPDGAPKLEAGDVYISYGEAANSNYVPKYTFFLASSTLNNIAQNAADGFAFMNSHATGGVSHPGTLPFGRTFAGEVVSGADSKGRDFMAANIGWYMTRGVFPMGAQGPSTDDLWKMMQTGQVFDLSVGLSRGDMICDLCAYPVEQPFNDKTGEGCPHIPGTYRAMTEEQKATQKMRGVPMGFATYSMHNAKCGECSAVFDGAIDGAGIRKVFAMASNLGDSDNEDAREIKLAYTKLCGNIDVTLSREEAEGLQVAPSKGRKMGLFDKLLGRSLTEEEKGEVRTELGIPAVTVLGAEPTKVFAAQLGQTEDNAAMTALQAENAKLQKQLQDGLVRNANEWAKALTLSGCILPAQMEGMAKLYVALTSAADLQDFAVAWEDGQTPLSAVGFVEQLARRSQHKLTEEAVPSGFLSNGFGSQGTPAALLTAKFGEETGKTETAPNGEKINVLSDADIAGMAKMGAASQGSK